ncbi:putative thioesterase family domain protein [Rhodococcus wratislaviensis]|uniref:Putative thioesterase family domain protein n=1 Tax=Rhodococcus wratislaviensis TaxID=44752 RepID=A0A402CKW8_RHOWR|nr:thioesterase family protein [Rhodococcus wratislaviensis]GCE44244.1 putative thioesterase family domain protein [Rhodococcus wratislaviensis]
MTAAPAGGYRASGTHHTRVEWIDTDAAGIYHNSTAVRFVEAAEATMMAEHGLHDYFPHAPRVRYEVDFESPLRFGQPITTSVEIEHLGTASMRIQFEIWGEATDGRPRRRAASGSYTTVHISGDHSGDGATSSPWPTEWVTALTRPPRQHQSASRQE